MELVTLGHPKAQSKLAPGVKAVIVGLHPMYVTNCFQLVRSDGSREDFSYRKCVRHPPLRVCGCSPCIL
jgi:DNA-directed RNA polymerase-4 subunit 1